jgi:FKBP-type peptidyl-prolyl cis-trans isomerase
MRHHLSFARRAAAATLVILAAGCLKGTEPGTPSNPATETYAASLGVNLAQMTKISDDLYIQDVIAGGGTQAAALKTLNVTYTGWLVNGTQFESNIGKSPLSFMLATNAVIPGWDLGLVGMRAGGTRRLVIGSNLGYGSGGNGIIPGNATLVFVVQLLSVQ